jgi:hypothetical protein
MADIISINKVAIQAKKESADEINDFKLRGLEEITEQVKDENTKGYVMFAFDEQGNSMVTAAGQIDPADCCLALERVKYQIITDEGDK